MADKLFLVDSAALIYRSYYAFINNPLINSQGIQTSAIFGFASGVLRLIQEEKPSYLAIVKDLPEPTFRHEMYSEYKANRKPMPDDLRDQLPYIDEFIEASGLPHIAEKGYEADDVMGTLALMAKERGMETFIVTRDKDMMQIVDDSIALYEPGARGQPPTIKGPKEVEAKFEVTPDKIVDLLALMGDSADNVPGVKKVGQKTAATLLNTYGNLEKIYDNIDNITRKALKKNLEEDRDNAFLSRDLVELKCDIPLHSNFEFLKVKDLPIEELSDFLKKLELNSLLQYVKNNGSSQKSEEKAAPQKLNYQLAADAKSLEKLEGELKKAKTIAFDTETTGLDVLTADLVGLCLSTKAATGWYIPLDHEEGPNTSMVQVKKILHGLLQDENKTWVFHNAKYDLPILERFGLAPAHPEKIVDTLVAAYLDNPGSRGLSLDVLAETLFSHQMISIESLIGKKGKNQKTFREVPIEEAQKYGAEDADITFRLWEHFEKKLRGKGDLNLLFKEELPLLFVLKKMEHRGVKVDSAQLHKLSETIGSEIAAREKNIHKLAEEEFNINSTQKLGEILFDKLKLKAGKKTKTGYSTDASVLQGLKGSHPIIQDLIDYREFTKLKNTYIDVLPTLVHENTGRIHTSFSQTIAATGRLSSINPNLQNIPIRTDWGKKIRACFIPEGKNRVLLAADYSQIELRVLAHLSQDPGLMRAYKEGVDIHTQTASALYQVEEKDVTSDMRRSAKVVNFGVLYGMGPQRLSRELEIERKEASNFIENYFNRYAGVQDFIDKTVASARKKGFVTTLTGRRRYLPEISSSNRMHQENASRMAVNTPIQGTAADIIKRAMVNLDAKLEASMLPCDMLLQVHDELVFEVEASVVEEATELIVNEMESAIPLTVPLVVETGTGKDWLKAHG